MSKNGDDASMNEVKITDTRSAQLAVAYAAAHYFVTVGHKEWLFCVGQQAEDIERELDAGTYLFITAWNPASAAATPAENSIADKQLQAAIHQSGLAHHRSLGSNAQGSAVEYGWVVLDASAEVADRLAREFGQAATLYWTRGEAVRLRMLSPRPAGLSDHPHTDWAG